MDKCFTPATIGKEEYTIPIYQRLFEWGDSEIKQLLCDLLDGKTNSADSPYYIGMLTATAGAKSSLVDGQQRFTVMMLMGVIMQKFDARWYDFLMIDGHLRLTFSAREEDQEYLSCLVKHYKDNAEEYKSENYENDKMKKGVRTICEFLAQCDDKDSFCKYVYENMTFFISELPDNYSTSDLNKYFERMNSTGKNLEGHEILKVKMLGKKGFLGDKKLYTKLWNRVSEMDSPLFDVRYYLGENVCQLKNRIQKALDVDTPVEDILTYDIKYPLSAIINGLGGADDSTGSGESIFDLGQSDEEPKKQGHYGEGSRGVMNFTEFLLQVLFYKYGKDVKDDNQIVTFFNPSLLVKTFEKYFLDTADGTQVEDFFKFMLRARILLDVYFIRINDKDGDFGYSLEWYEEASGNEERILLEKIRMFQSMIYVNSSPVTYYKWFANLIDYTNRPLDNDTKKPIISTCDFYNYWLAKDNEDEKHSKELISDINALWYPKIDRYWFWRLDYYIWLNRETLFKDDEHARKVADRYVFRRNRSIEHIAPQTPQQVSTLEWDDKMNGFGNLVMISSDQNSSLRNSVYKEKQGRVKAHIDESRTGTIESLKLLLAFTENQKWDLDSIARHGERTHKILLESYPETSE